MGKDKADIWMPMYWGDYLKDTMHLTTEQHGAYLLIIGAYWSNGGPLDGDTIQTITRLSNDAWSIHQAVLKKFFKENDAGQWVHKRLDSELESSKEKKAKAIEKARKAANIRHGNTCLEHATSNAWSNQQAMLKPCPSPSSSDIINSTPLPPKGADCPHEKIIEAYHEILPTLPKVRKWGDTGKKKLRSRWKSDKEYQSVEWWRAFFKNSISTSDFLMGRKTDFTATLMWIVGKENFEKIMNGEYVNRGSGSTPQKPDDPFELGYAAAKNGLPDTPPSGTDNEKWLEGYRWYQHKAESKN